MQPSDDRLKDTHVAAFVSSMQMRGFRLEDYARELQQLQARSAGMTPEQFNLELDGIDLRVCIGITPDDSGPWPESPGAD